MHYVHQNILIMNNDSGIKVKRKTVLNFVCPISDNEKLFYFIKS